MGVPDALLPSARMAEANKVSVRVLQWGCRPADCCKNTSCESVKADASIPRQAAGCQLPTGCFFHASALARVSGATCHGESGPDFWRAARAVSFDLVGLEGWEFEPMGAVQVHNVFTKGCSRGIHFALFTDTQNLPEKAAQRNCWWPPEKCVMDDTRGLVEFDGAPLTVITPAEGIQIPLDPTHPHTPADATHPHTLRIGGLLQDQCAFHLDDYWKFPVLDLHLRLIVKPSPTAMLDTMAKTLLKPQLLAPKTDPLKPPHAHLNMQILASLFRQAITKYNHTHNGTHNHTHHGTHNHTHDGTHNHTHDGTHTHTHHGGNHTHDGTHNHTHDGTHNHTHHGGNHTHYDDDDYTPEEVDRTPEEVDHTPGGDEYTPLGGDHTPQQTAAPPLTPISELTGSALIAATTTSAPKPPQTRVYYFTDFTLNPVPYRRLNFNDASVEMLWGGGLLIATVSFLVTKMFGRR